MIALIQLIYFLFDCSILLRFFFILIVCMYVCISSFISARVHTFTLVSSDTICSFQIEYLCQLWVSNYQYLYFAWKCLHGYRQRNCLHEELGGKLASVGVLMGKSCDEIAGVSAANNQTLQLSLFSSIHILSGILGFSENRLTLSSNSLLENM